MNIYIVRQRGVYWKEIVGVFTYEREAVDYAKKEYENDEDDYHDLIVTKHIVGDSVKFDNNVGRMEQNECESEVMVLKIGDH